MQTARTMLRDPAVSTALIWKVCGVLLVIFGVYAASRNSLDQLIIGGVMVLVGAGVFAWGFRRGI